MAFLFKGCLTLVVILFGYIFFGFLFGFLEMAGVEVPTSTIVGTILTVVALGFAMFLAVKAFDYGFGNGSFALGCGGPLAIMGIGYIVLSILGFPSLVIIGIAVVFAIVLAITAAAVSEPDDYY